jgi:hypothetical protein
MNSVTDEFINDEKNAVSIRTTLYDLIDALSRALPADEDELVVATVMQLLRSGRIRFLGNPECYN